MRPLILFVLPSASGLTHHLHRGGKLEKWLSQSPHPAPSWHDPVCHYTEILHRPCIAHSHSPALDCLEFAIQSSPLLTQNQLVPVPGPVLVFIQTWDDPPK